MLGRERNADAGADIDLLTAEIERPLDQGDDPERERDGSLALVLLVFLDDGEFVAAEASQHIGIANRRPQPLRHFDQQLVAGRMPQRVVDALELVEVEHQHGEAGAMALQPLRGVLELFGEQRAVRKAREQIDPSSKA